MSFLYPQFLFTLFALAIPVIIHLFNFRRYKKILFTNVRFLTDIQQESKSRNRLRHLLLLLLRLLALAFIIIAFAQPYIPNKKSLVNPGRNYISVYIDNSFSMTNIAAQGDLLSVAKRKAEETARAYREGDAFQLITNDFELKHQRWVNREEFLQLLNEVATSPVSRNLSEVYLRTKEGLRTAESGNRFSYWFSDFQENTSDFEKIAHDSGLNIHAVLVKANAQNNVYIDSAWFENSVWQLNQSNSVSARIVNNSDNSIEEGTVTLLINGKQKALGNFTIPARSNVEVKVNFTVTDEGPNRAQLQITDYPVTFDDNWYFSFPVSRFLPVLSINGQKFTNNIEKAFGAETAFHLQQVSEGSIDYSSLGQNNFIVLNEIGRLSSGLAAASKTFIENGGNVLLLPAAQDADASTYGQLLAACNAGDIGSVESSGNTVGDIDLRNPFFHNIFEDIPRNINLPEAKKYYRILTPSGSRAVTLLRFNNGDPFLVMVPVGKGYLFVSAVPLEADWSNLANHALFLPMLYKMALYRSSMERISYTIGRDNYIRVQGNSQDDKEKIYKLKRNNFEVIPPQRSLEGGLSLFVEGLIKDAGFYELENKSSSGEKQVFAFNYDRKESVMKFMNEEEIKDKGTHLNIKFLDVNKASLTTEIKQIRQGSGLWRLFVILALVCIFAETALIRFYKQ